MAIEQRGDKKKYYGCKDQLMITNAILKNCRKQKRNLSTAWINYKKAFDSVPHSWIIKCMSLYKVQFMIIRLIESPMSKWKTNMTPAHSQRALEMGSISIKRGIFWGDSLSLNPLSTELQETGYGSKLNEKTDIIHSFYVDDPKLYGTSNSEVTRFKTLSRWYQMISKEESKYLQKESS